VIVRWKEIAMRGTWSILCLSLLSLVMGGVRAQERPDIPPIPDPSPALNNPHVGNAESIRSGMTLYRVRCADCHGLDARGYRGPDLVAALAGGMADEKLFQTIRKGVPGTEMPPSRAPDDELLMLIAYLRKTGTVTAPARPIGNVENGARLFAANCTSCHRVDGRGGRLGPDLTRIGVARSHAALVREIRTPSEWVAPQYETVTVVLKDGTRVRGTKKNEDVFTIQIMDVRERIQGYVKANLQEVIYEKNSLMPAYGTGQLSESDLSDLVGYLSTLRGGNNKS
jgi:putative heme-binding domain-containing protein